MEIKLNRKAQSLPLNTIVIALLVIIVLLVIVVFFTSSVSKTGDTIDANSPTGCSLSNPAIKSLGYTKVYYQVKSTSCDTGDKEISFVPVVKGTIKNTDRTSVELDDKNGVDLICCGHKD